MPGMIGEREIGNAEVFSLFERHKRRALRCFLEGRFDAACFYVDRAAHLMYEYNLVYADDDLETVVAALSSVLFDDAGGQVETSKECRATLVDSFGLSYRGLAWVYAKGLLDAGYDLQYIAPAKAVGSTAFAPLASYLEKAGVIVEYAPNMGRMARARWIASAVRRHSSSAALFHGTPWDVPSLVALGSLPDSVKTYLINLTDHAFWLGARSFDRYIEFRGYGAAVSALGRGIPERRLALLPYYPMQAIASVPFAGLPFGEGAPFFVSGGAAYKTEGDEAFPSLVRAVLGRWPDLQFLFLSSSMPSWFAGVEREFPGRVYFGPERDDLLEVVRRSLFYLNTYPMYGGLMTQIAAMAGKVPVTLLLEGSEPATKLLTRPSGGIDFDTPEAALAEIGLLVSDAGYRARRSVEMLRAMDGPEEFAAGLTALLSGGGEVPEVRCDLEDDEFISSYLRRANRVRDLARVNFSKEDLLHRTAFEPITWLGLWEKVKLWADGH